MFSSLHSFSECVYASLCVIGDNLIKNAIKDTIIKSQITDLIQQEII